jgi:hypothetical protein
MIASIVVSALLALQGPQVELWTDRGDATVYHRGERVRVYFRADADAYITVLRVDTDGRVRVLFPRDPWDDNFARAGQAYEVRPAEVRYAFDIDEYPGQGYVFAIASLDPFDYRAIVLGDHWDYRAIATSGRITGDPYVAVQDLADLIVPASYDAYGYDLTTYYVEQYYDYPRFLCYDCHSYVAYTAWDPYHYSCNRFRIVVYDDPYYYPARVYPANRVVYRRVARIEPRYVFKDRTPTEAYVVRVRQRPAEQPARRADERGITGRDLGGVGTVRTPVREPAVRVTEPQGVRGLAPTRRPDPVSQPVTAPRRGPERETPTTAPTPPDRRRTTSGTVAPTPDRRTPQVIQRPVEPRAVPQRETPPAPAQERPKLERREPPRPAPAARPQPQQPKAEPRPPAPKPQPQVPAKKPDPPPRRRPGG